MAMKDGLHDQIALLTSTPSSTDTELHKEAPLSGVVFFGSVTYVCLFDDKGSGKTVTYTLWDRDNSDDEFQQVLEPNVIFVGGGNEYTTKTGKSVTKIGYVGGKKEVTLGYQFSDTNAGDLLGYIVLGDPYVKPIKFETLLAVGS